MTHFLHSQKIGFLCGAMALPLAMSLPAPALALQDNIQEITDKEKAVGEKAHPELLEEFGGAYNAPQTDYVVAIGKNIAFQSGLGNAKEDFTVTLLNSPVNNAFAIPGGYVYVTRQLLGLMNDEAELAGVMGHEVGHVAARHSEKRQSAAKTNAILGMIGQIASQVLLGNSMWGNLGQQLFGTGSQLLTLRYSRGQEREADKFGVQYLSSAGYDPNALSTMLYSLALQNQLDAQSKGKEGGVPEWVSTHPDPAKRVKDAVKYAKKYPDSSYRNRDVFMQQIDGLLYGDDPKQGIVNGNEFVHPDLKFKFTAPTGFTMINGSTAITIEGDSGKSQFSLGPYSGNLDNYVTSVFDAFSASSETKLTPGEISKTTINGIPAAYAAARTTSGQSQLDVVVFAYAYDSKRAYHFVSITEAGRASNFNAMYSSFAKLTNEEAAKVKPRKIKVLTVAEGDTMDSLSKQMAFDNLQKERFMVLNGFHSKSTLAVGQKVKIVVF